MKLVCASVVGVVCLASTPFASAQDSQPAAPAAAPASPDDLTKWGFGTGIMFLSKVSGADRVTDAVVDSNGFVRVNKRENTSAGLVLELHHFFQSVKDKPWGIGPFIAVKAGSTNIIDAVGAGVMIGFRNGDSTSHTSFNLGIGYAGILAAQSLGDEFVADQKAPVDSAGKPLAIRYQTRDAGSLMLMASFTF